MIPFQVCVCLGEPDKTSGELQRRYTADAVLVHLEKRRLRKYFFAFGWQMYYSRSSTLVYREVNTLTSPSENKKHLHLRHIRTYHTTASIVSDAGVDFDFDIHVDFDFA